MQKKFKIAKYKICSKCKLMLEIGKFYKSASQSDGIQSYCKKCNLHYIKEAYPKLNVTKRRAYSRKVLLKSKYGMTPEEYKNIFIGQNGVCAICHRAETQISNKSGGVDSLRVDHCHETGRVRGLLCSRCNFGISNFRDNLGNITSALSYILKHKQSVFGIMHEEDMIKKLSTYKNNKGVV